MSSDAVSMIVPKEQWWSLSMISKRGMETPASNGDARQYSFFWARNAIYHSLSLLGIERGKHILLPSYLCRAAVEPFIAYGASIDFYSVKRDCSPDISDLEKKITTNTRAVLMVHYFGFPQAVTEFRRLCDNHGIALIEDCAHVLCGKAAGEPIGTIGDAAVFSWRKFLPVYDGAALILNRPASGTIELAKESSFFSVKIAANVLEASLARSRQPFLRLGYQAFRTAETVVRKLAKSSLQTAAANYPEVTSVEFDERNMYWPMSRLSRWTLEHSNIGRIVAKRRYNYELLLRELTTARIVPLFAELPPSVCPWVLPVFFDRLPDAHLRLRDRGIPAVTWGGVRHPSVDGSIFSDADFLYDNLVFLPIHQCLEDADVLNMAKTITQVCAA